MPRPPTAEPQTRNPNDLSRFRTFAAGLSLAVILALALCAAPWDRPVSIGLAMGGGIRVLLFWLGARRAELAIANPDTLESFFYTRFWVRMSFYAVVLTKAYFLDPGQLHGFGGAAAGLIVVGVTVRLSAVGRPRSPNA